MDPNPDYDASDEIEYGMNWFAWILRGVYPPPAYPPVCASRLSPAQTRPRTCPPSFGRSSRGAGRSN